MNAKSVNFSALQQRVQPAYSQPIKSSLRHTPRPSTLPHNNNTMKFLGILAALAAATTAVAAPQGGDECGLNITLCSRVKEEGLSCCTEKQVLIDVLNTMGWQICQEDSSQCWRGERMQQLARDLSV